MEAIAKSTVVMDQLWIVTLPGISMGSVSTQFQHTRLVVTNPVGRFLYEVSKI